MAAVQARATPTCAVVVNWNGWQDTIVCLESLFAQGVPLRVVVCDNGSGNDSVDRLGQWLQQRLHDWTRSNTPNADTWLQPGTPGAQGVEAVCLLAIGTNRGYAGGLNVGIGWAQAQWGSHSFWLLNNDVEARPDALRALQEAHAATPHAGLCGSVLMDWERPGAVQIVAGAHRRWLGVGADVRELPPGSVLVGVDYPAGASLYVVQDYLDRVGLMDDSYFLYGEEMDWAERGRRAGFVAIIALASRLKHKVGASTGARGRRDRSLLSERYGVVNRLRLTLRFWPHWLPAVWLSLFAVAADRAAHGEFSRAALVLRCMFTPRLWSAHARPVRPDIVFCHLNDDNSGSPRVLVQSIRALEHCFQHPLAFVSSSRSGGFLGRSGVPLERYTFGASLRHPWLALSFLAGQLELFVKLALSRPLRRAPVYINTSLPVGGALFGFLSGRPVVFHSHEIPHSAFEKLAFALTVRCSAVVVCVSRSHAMRLPLPRGRMSSVVVVPNALDPEFAEAAGEGPKVIRSSGSFCVLYVTAALTPQKGWPEFVRLARALQERTDIELLVATSQHESGSIPDDLPPNVHVHGGEGSLLPLYRRADVLLNVSHPELCVETFGLTILEAMAFGTPAIVPPVGGPAELVRNGEEGFQVDPRDTDRLSQAVTQLADDRVLWSRLSTAARRRAADFSFADYERALVEAVESAVASA